MSLSMSTERPPFFTPGGDGGKGRTHPGGRTQHLDGGELDRAPKVQVEDGVAVKGVVREAEYASHDDMFPTKQGLRWHHKRRKVTQHRNSSAIV